MSKLKTKDYIFAGAFAAIFIVFIVVTISIFTINPLMQLIGPLISIIIGGPIFFLYVTKVPKRGAILVLTMLMSLTMISTSIFPLIICAVAGILGEVFAGLGKYSSKGSYTVAYGIVSMAIMSPLGVFFVAREAYLDQIIKFYGQAYADTLNSYASNGVLMALFGVAFVAGLIGSVFGQKLLKKHFEKAGIV